MTLLAVCGDASTTTAYALAAMWPTPDVLLVEGDPTGGDLAAWLDVAELPGVATAVTMAPTGAWPVIEAQVQHHGLLRVLVMPVRAGEAAIAAREATTRIIPTLSALSGLTAVVDCGFCHPAAPSTVVTQAALVVVTVRQPRTSSRAAAAHLDRVGELVDALGSRMLPTVVAVIGEEPYRASEIGDFLGGSPDRVRVVVIADDPVGAAAAAGRERVGRGFARSHLARSAATVANELAVRLESLHSLDVGGVRQ
ncbi:MAG: hypothetical protein AB7V43_01130 [Acidimicrobiia bacterium]